MGTYIAGQPCKILKCTGGCGYTWVLPVHADMQASLCSTCKEAVQGVMYVPMAARSAAYQEAIHAEAAYAQHSAGAMHDIAACGFTH